MTREQLEHLIRAAAVIADDDTIVVIGSQAVLGQFPDAPEPMRVSVEANLFPLHHPERADLIEGSIGELSPFHQTFGYYAQGVAEETAVLPEGWRDRLVEIRNESTRGAKGLCLEVHDFLVAKVIAGREKDLAFLKNAAKHRMADPDELLRRLGTVAIAPEVREKASAAIVRAFRGGAERIVVWRGDFPPSNFFPSSLVGSTSLEAPCSSSGISFVWLLRSLICRTKPTASIFEDEVQILNDGRGAVLPWEGPPGIL